MATATKYVQTFDSVTDLLAACDRAAVAGRLADQDALKCPSFVGREFSSWADARDAAESPWQEGLDILQEMIFEIDRERIEVPAALDVRRRRRWSADDGDDICLDRLRAGQDAWQSTSRQQATAPRQVTIWANVAAAAKVPHEEILWRGAAAICLADLLEKQGYRVELMAADYGVNTFEERTFALGAVRLKAMSEPLDISTIVNALAGWFFRSVTFQSYFIDRVPVDDGYGRPAKLTADVDAVADMSRGSTPIVMDGVFSRDAALALIRRTVAELAS